MSFDGIVPEFVDQNQIGINLHAIHRLCRLGGIKNLHVVGVNGETSSFTPAVVGMDGKGHALAGWIGTKVEVPTHEVNLGKSDHHVMHAASWIDVRISLNSNEISAQIADLKVQGGIRSPQAWSQKINKSLKEGIRQAGFKQLVSATSLQDKVISTIYNSNLIYGIDYIKWMLGAHTFSNLADFYAERRRLGENKDGLHLSLFIGPQLDRATALGIAGRVTKLVKVIKPSAK